MLQLLVLLLLLLLTVVATEPVQLELQASTVGRSGGGRIFVLTSDPTLANATVSVTGAVQAQRVAVAQVESAHDGLLLVAVPGGLPAAAYQLTFDLSLAGSRTGASVTVTTPPINAPEPHWATPRGRAGDVLAVHGRRFGTDQPGVTVLLAPAAAAAAPAAAPVRVSAHVENENRATFLLPAGQSSLAPGQYQLQYEDSWGTWSADPPMVIEVLPSLPVAKIVNASLPPYFADATGATDAAPAIVAALRDAGSGGTVALGAGVFMLGLHEWRNHSDDNCRTMGAAVCLPPTAAESGSSSSAQQQLAVTIRGLGSGVTTLRQGATAQISFWGSAVSLADLTLSDALPAGQTPRWVDLESPAFESEKKQTGACFSPDIP